MGQRLGVLLASVLIGGCSFSDAGRSAVDGALTRLDERKEVLRRAGEQAGTGFITPIEQRWPPTIRKAAEELVDALLGEESKRFFAQVATEARNAAIGDEARTQVRALLRSAIAGAGDQLDSEARQLMTTLDEWLAPTARQTVSAVVDQIGGEETTGKLTELVASVIEGAGKAAIASAGELGPAVLGEDAREALRQAVAQARDELLGPATQDRLETLLDQLFDRLDARVQKLGTDVGAQAREEIGVLQRHAVPILIAVLVAAGAIVWLVRSRGKETQRSLELMGRRVDTLRQSHPTVYEELATGARDDAARHGCDETMDRALRERRR